MLSFSSQDYDDPHLNKQLSLPLDFPDPSPPKRFWLCFEDHTACLTDAPNRLAAFVSSYDLGLFHGGHLRILEVPEDFIPAGFPRGSRLSRDELAPWLATMEGDLFETWDGDAFG